MQMRDFFGGGGNFLIFSAALMETIVTKGDVEQKWKSYNLHKKTSESNKSLAFYNPIRFPIFAKYKM